MKILKNWLHALFHWKSKISNRPLRTKALLQNHQLCEAQIRPRLMLQIPSLIDHLLCL